MITIPFRLRFAVRVITEWQIKMIDLLLNQTEIKYWASKYTDDTDMHKDLGYLK